MDKPVGEKITSVNPLLGALGALSTLKDVALGVDVSGRDKAMTDDIGGIRVDTCIPTDTNVWETGILRQSIEGKWIIVGQYLMDDEAKRGHKRWVAYMKENPTCELEDIDNWNLEGGLNGI